MCCAAQRWSGWIEILPVQRPERAQNPAVTPSHTCLWIVTIQSASHPAYRFAAPFSSTRLHPVKCDNGAGARDDVLPLSCRVAVRGMGASMPGSCKRGCVCACLDVRVSHIEAHGVSVSQTQDTQSGSVCKHSCHRRYHVA